MTDELEPTHPSNEDDPVEPDVEPSVDATTAEVWVASRNGLAPRGDDGEVWVADSHGETERAPGIDDVHETTYVEPNPAPARWRMVVGAALALGGIAIFIALVFVARAREDDGSASGQNVDVTRTTSVSTPSTTSRSSSSSTSATTTVPGTSATTTGGAVNGSITAPPGGAAAPPAPAPAPTPPATADPALPAYVPVPIPAGVTATLGSCSWQPANGGTLQASGTITGVSAKADGWQITVRWLQNSRELAQQATHVDLAVGTTLPWSVSVAAPVPPADLSCAVEVA